MARTTRSTKEKDIREKMIKAGIIKQMVTLPSNMFTSVTLPATLWFFDKEKCNSDKKDEILFIDARNVFTQIDRAHRKFSEEQIKNLAVISRLYEGKTQALADLLNEYKEEMQNAPTEKSEKNPKNKAYFQEQIDWLNERFPKGVYEDVIGLCKVAKIDGEDGIAENDFSLNAGRYVGVVIEDDGMTEEEFRNHIKRLNSELDDLSESAISLKKEIAQNIKGLFGE